MVTPVMTSARSVSRTEYSGSHCTMGKRDCRSRQIVPPKEEEEELFGQKRRRPLASDSEEDEEDEQELELLGGMVDTSKWELLSVVMVVVVVVTAKVAAASGASPLPENVKEEGDTGELMAVFFILKLFRTLMCSAASITGREMKVDSVKIIPIVLVIS
ncbi:hypothetical protein TYRP_023245 [Tyrophagus putrescentiae]|nr:hypothetical protein TYRP_023245 [Tyrophagus putrescentiae]